MTRPEMHADLRDRLANIEGKFLLSYDDVPLIRKLCEGFKIEKRISQGLITVENDSVKKNREMMELDKKLEILGYHSEWRLQKVEEQLHCLLVPQGILESRS